MKTTVKNHFLLMLTLMAAFSSCKKEETPGYEGTNEILLVTDKGDALRVGDEKTITVLLKATQKALRDTRFEINIISLQENDKSVPIEIKEKEIILKQGEYQTEFHLRVKAEETDAKAAIRHYELNIPSMPDKQMKLKNNMRFRLISVDVPKLTEEQLKLIDGYMAKGINITPFLGKVPVKATVKIPADGLIEGFKNPETKNFTGFSIITLSEHATPETPILKMVDNPMGLTEFFYFGLTMNTIKNYEFWYQPLSSPHVIEIRKLLNWDDKSVEEFRASLDSVRIIPKKEGDNYKIEYLGPNISHYDEPITNVPFKFYYSAWERQKKRMAEKDERVIECYANGARANPGTWINISNLLVSRYDDNDKMPLTKGQWAVKENKLQFAFLTDIDNAGWYCSVEVEYTGK